MTQRNNTVHPSILASVVATSLTPFGLDVQLYRDRRFSFYPWDTQTNYGVFGRYVGEDRWHDFKEKPPDFFQRLAGKKWQLLIRKTPENLDNVNELAQSYGPGGIYITTSPADNSPNAVYLPEDDYPEFREWLNKFQILVEGGERIGGVYVPRTATESGWTGPTIEETANLVRQLPPGNPLRSLLPEGR